MTLRVEKVDVHREQFRTSDLENFRTSSAMRDFFKDNFVMKRIHRAPKNLCQLSQHAFSKTVQLWTLCRTVRGKITRTKGGVLSQKERCLKVNYY